mgnify:CR=1 FL=1
MLYNYKIIGYIEHAMPCDIINKAISRRKSTFLLAAYSFIRYLCLISPFIGVLPYRDMSGGESVIYVHTFLTTQGYGGASLGE